MNNIINDPFRLKNFIDKNGLIKDIELKIMTSGDSWNSEKGFQISENGKDFYLNKDLHISNYKDSVEDILEKFYSLENRLKPNSRIIKMFQQQILSIPKFMRKKFKNYFYNNFFINRIYVIFFSIL